MEPENCIFQKDPKGTSPFVGAFSGSTLRECFAPTPPLTRGWYCHCTWGYLLTWGILSFVCKSPWLYQVELTAENWWFRFSLIIPKNNNSFVSVIREFQIINFKSSANKHWWIVNIEIQKLYQVYWRARSSIWDCSWLLPVDIQLVV